MFSSRANCSEEEKKIQSYFIYFLILSSVVNDSLFPILCQGKFWLCHSIN